MDYVMNRVWRELDEAEDCLQYIYNDAAEICIYGGYKKMIIVVVELMFILPDCLQNKSPGFMCSCLPQE